MINKNIRAKCEEKIYKYMKIVDKTGQNTEFYKKKFAAMNDKEFYEFFQQDFPLKFQTKVFEIEPTMTDILDGLKFLGVPALERISMPFLYENKDGIPVSTLPVIVVYLPIRRMKQMVQKKTGYSVNISKRDYRTGLLIDTDKNGNSTDREFESLVVMGLEKTTRELATYRADSMQAKSSFYATISALGYVSQQDVPVDNEDSIARNLISAYLLGSHLESNLIMDQAPHYLPRTLKKKRTEQSGLKRQE